MLWKCHCGGRASLRGLLHHLFCLVLELDVGCLLGVVALCSVQGDLPSDSFENEIHLPPCVLLVVEQSTSFHPHRFQDFIGLLLQGQQVVVALLGSLVTSF